MNHTKLFAIIGVNLFFAVILAVAGYWYINEHFEKDNSPLENSGGVSSASKNFETEEWNLYSNPKDGYSLRYPGQLFSVQTYPEDVRETDDPNFIASAYMPSDIGDMEISLYSGTMDSAEEFLKEDNIVVASQRITINGRPGGTLRMNDAEYPDDLSYFYILMEKDPKHIFILGSSDLENKRMITLLAEISKTVTFSK